MFRVSLANVFAKRTLKPLHEKHQATPVKVDLDPAETGDIFSGMVAAQGTNGAVIADGDSHTGAEILGLFGLDRNDVINDLDGQPADLAPFVVWQGGPDAYFLIKTPAWDSLQAISGVGDLLYVNDGNTTGTIGQLTSLDPGSGTVVAVVVEVKSATELVIRLDSPSLA